MNDTLFGGVVNQTLRGHSVAWNFEEEFLIEEALHDLYEEMLLRKSAGDLSKDSQEYQVWQGWPIRNDYGVWEWHK